MNRINWGNKEVLVCGGVGFVGSHLATELVRLGSKVTVVDNLSSGSEQNVKAIRDDIKFESKDLRDYGVCRKLVNGKDCVFQLAANMGGIGYITAIGADIMRDSAIININMLDVARVHETPMYFYSSSACVYPDYLQKKTAVRPLREADAIPADPDQFYGWEKLFTEKLCLTPNTKVLTTQGWKPIKDIKEDELVITHKGRSRRVTETSVRAYSGNMIEIIVSTGHSGELKNCRLIATPDHRILTEYGWRPIGQLKEGDKVAVHWNYCPVCNKKMPFTNQHCTRSCGSKAKWLKPDYREKQLKVIRAMGAKQMHTPQARANWRRAFETRLRNNGKHNHELYIDLLLQWIFPGVFEFTGDGRQVICGFYPDWLNQDNKWIIEYQGRAPRHPEHFNHRLEQWAREGYSTLVLGGRDFAHPKVLIEKVKEFTGVEPREVMIADGGMSEPILLPIKHIHQLEPLVKRCRNVYSLEVEDDNSFIAGGIIVHNCEAYMQDYKMNIRMARFHNIFGPCYTAFDSLKGKAPGHMIIKAIKHPNPPYLIWGDGRQTRSFLYIDDCVQAVLRLMGTDHKEAINIGSDRLISMKALVDMAVRLSGKKGVKFQYDLSKPQGVRGRNADLKIMKEVLMWEPQVSLEKGMEITYNWAVEHYDELEGL